MSLKKAFALVCGVMLGALLMGAAYLVTDKVGTRDGCICMEKK